jgi:hypothetical protein
MDNNKTPLQNLFDNRTETLNGDEAFKSTNSNLIDILFQVNWLKTHTDEIAIGDSRKERLFAMFMRDCRYGIGARNVGRQLLKLTKASFEEILLCGRGDDIWKMYSDDELTSKEMADFYYKECAAGNELVKKWMPRWTPRNTREVSRQDAELELEHESHTIASNLKNADELSKLRFEDGVSSAEETAKPASASKTSNKVKKEYTEHQLRRMLVAKKLAKMWNMNKQQYKKFVKCDTVETKLSHKRWDEVAFEHVPSLAMIKYARTFISKPEFAERYKQYLDDVRSGVKKMNTSVATVYDIYKARHTEGFDPDIWFDKMPKIDISAMVICDTSGSMSCNDAKGKALSICHYLSKCSSYCQNQFITFSESPELMNITGDTYNDQIDSIWGADWDMNTDLGAVARLLQNLKGDLPDWLIIVSDMQFDRGSTQEMHELMDLWHKNGWKTKIVWWNLSEINATTPETVEGGNIFMSGLSPMLLKYLSVGFDADRFLDELLLEYQKNIKGDYIELPNE